MADNNSRWSWYQIGRGFLTFLTILTAALCIVDVGFTIYNYIHNDKNSGKRRRSIAMDSAEVGQTERSIMTIMLTGLQTTYICLAAPLLLAAFLEWILWLCAFLFALYKVYQKAEHWTTRVIAAIMMFLFTFLRSASDHFLSDSD